MQMEHNTQHQQQGITRMQHTNPTWKESRDKSLPRQILKEQQTWWQTQSELCGVPNGVSYELDKGRSNRIKALGNSIVPQIAREIGLAILEAEK
jgi:hypothetical protein